MNPLHAIAFLDGRLGHEKQTRGVLQALAALTPLEVEYRRLPPPSFRSGLRDWLALFSSWLLPSRPGAESFRTADLLVGAGCYTQIPMLLLQKEYRQRHGGPGPRVITFMLPNFPLRYLMDLCFVPQSDRLGPQPNVFTTIGPPNTAVCKGCHERNRGLILVGGIDARSHVWDSAATLERIKTILSREPEKQWTISSSPRTPAAMLEPLRQLASAWPQVEFFQAAETPPGWIEEQYALNWTVWVTADSMSMVYEALSAGCRVGLLPVAWKKKESLFTRSEAYLRAGNLVVFFAAWLAGENIDQGGRPLNEARRCAEEILRRWWPERLP